MEHEFLSAVPAQALQQALKNSNERTQISFKSLRRASPGSRRKVSERAFVSLKASRSTIKTERIKLPKLGWMRYRKSQDILGEARNVTVSESCGKWFVSIQTEREVKTPQHPSISAVGLDWGVVNFVTLSDGAVVEQCQLLKKFLPKLAKLQRRMERKEKFSKNWRKAQGKIAKLHSKIANIRKVRTQGFERHQQKPRGCLYRGPAGKEYEQVRNKEGGAKVWAESLHLGRQPVRVAQPARIQNAVAGRSACSCATAKHEPQVP